MADDIFVAQSLHALSYQANRPTQNTDGENLAVQYDILSTLAMYGFTTPTKLRELFEDAGYPTHKARAYAKAITVGDHYVTKRGFTKLSPAVAALANHLGIVGEGGRSYDQFGTSLEDFTDFPTHLRVELKALGIRTSPQLHAFYVGAGCTRPEAYSHTKKILRGEISGMVGGHEMPTTCALIMIKRIDLLRGNLPVVDEPPQQTPTTHIIQEPLPLPDKVLAAPVLLDAALLDKLNKLAQITTTPRTTEEKKPAVLFQKAEAEVAALPAKDVIIQPPAVRPPRSASKEEELEDYLRPDDEDVSCDSISDVECGHKAQKEYSLYSSDRSLDLFLAEMKQHKVLEPEEQEAVGQRILHNKREVISTCLMIPSAVKHLSGLYGELVDRRTHALPWVISGPDRSSYYTTQSKRSLPDRALVRKKAEQIICDLDALHAHMTHAAYEKDPADAYWETPDDLVFSLSKDLSTVYLKSTSWSLISNRLKANVAKQKGAAGETKETSSALSEKIDRSLKETVEDKEYLLKSNVRLVLKFIYTNGYDDPNYMMQNVQEGMLGLRKAIDRCDWVSAQLSTTAQWWIRQAITRKFIENAHVVYKPVHAYERASKIFKFEQKYAKEHGEKPDQAVIMTEFGLSEAQYEGSLNIRSQAVSLDQPVGEDGDETLGDFLLYAPDAEPVDRIATNDNSERVSQFLGTLTEREERVLRMRYFEDKTLEEVGQELKLTRERIRQIQNIAENRLRMRTKNQPEFSKDKFNLD